MKARLYVQGDEYVRCQSPLRVLRHSCPKKNPSERAPYCSKWNILYLNLRHSKSNTYKGTLYKKNGKIVWYFTQTGGGDLPPDQTISRFFSQKYFIALKWSTCSETWNKPIKYFSQLWPPLPLRSRWLTLFRLFNIALNIILVNHKK